jgi:hypothetical protein
MKTIGSVRKYSPGELPQPGAVFGRLTVLHVSRRLRKRGETSSRMTCLCSCGKKTRQKVHDLRNKVVQSCGCWCREMKTRHGQSYSDLYSIWKGMIRRCHNPKNDNWDNYGGRGITVALRWRCLGFFVRFDEGRWIATLCNMGFKNFMDDMGKRPSRKYSLDRIDNNKGYSPNNCKWSTKKQQANNTRTCLKNRPPVLSLDEIEQGYA